MKDVAFYIGEFVVWFLSLFAMILAAHNIRVDTDSDEPITWAFVVSLFWNLILLTCGAAIFLAVWRMG